jgi:hypothetical protein
MLWTKENIFLLVALGFGAPPTVLCCLTSCRLYQWSNMVVFQCKYASLQLHDFIFGLWLLVLKTVFLTYFIIVFITFCMNSTAQSKAKDEFNPLWVIDFFSKRLFNFNVHTFHNTKMCFARQGIKMLHRWERCCQK